MATAADTCAELARNIQLYVAEHAKLPEGFDSLVTTDGTAFYGDEENDGTTPGLIASSPNLCSMTTLTTITTATGDKRINSMTRNGLKSVYDHDVSKVPLTNAASNSATTYREVASGGKFLCVTPASNLWNLIYPVGLPQSEVDDTNVSLVCLGVGPNTTMVGRTLVEAPMYAASFNNNPDLDYRRFVAIFAVFKDGSRAQLKGVVDSFGRTNNQDLQQFIQAKTR